MNKTIKFIISIIIGLLLFTAAGITASAANTYCAVSPSGGGQKVYFTDQKLYYEQNRTEPCKYAKEWVAKYDPDTNTLTLRGYHGGTITFDSHPDGLSPRIELIYSNTITVTEPGKNGYYSGIYTRANADSLTIDRSKDATGSVAMYIDIKPKTVADNGSLVAVFTPSIKEIFTYADVCITVDNPEKNRELFQAGIYQTVGKVYKMSNGEEVPYNPLLHVLGDSEFIIYMYTAYPKKITGFSNYAYNGIVHANTSNKIIIDSSDVYGSPAVKGLVVDKASDISVKSRMEYAVPPRAFYTPLDESKYAFRQVYSRVNSSYSARFRNGKSYELTVDYGKNEYGSRAVTKARYIAGEEVRIDPVYDHRADGVLFSEWDCEFGIGYLKMPSDPYTKFSTLKMPAFDTTMTAIYSAPVTAEINGVYSNRGTVVINDTGKNTAAVLKGKEFTVTVLPGTGFTARDFDKSFITSGKATFVKRDGETFTFTKYDNDPVTLSIPLQYIDYKITYHLPPKSFVFTATGSSTNVPENFTFYNYGVHRRLPANSDVKCSETGYRLEGWYRKYDSSTGVYSDGPYQAVPNDVSGDIQFFAKWAEDEGAMYPIEHYATAESPKNGGYTISGLSETIADYQNIIFELCPSAGYEIDDTVIPYIGYMRKNGAGYAKITPTKLAKGRYSFDMPEDVKKSVKIYASDVNDGRSAFKRATYTITYDPNGGEKSSDFDSYMPQTYTIEDDLYLSPSNNTITRRGYTFKNWCFDEKCSTAPIYYIKRGNIHGDITLYAKWEPTKYTVSVYTDGNKSNVSEYGSVIQSQDYVKYRQEFFS